MHNVWLIARREYLERIRTRGFIITTVMIPAIFASLVLGSVFLGSKGPPDTRIAVVSSDTQLALDLQAELQQESEQRPARPSLEVRKRRIVVDAMDNAPDTRSIVDQEMRDGDLDGYLWITPATVPAERPAFAFTPRSSADGTIKDTLATALTTVLIREQLAHRGIVAVEANTLLQPVQIVTVQGAHQEDRESAEISVSVLFFFMYLVIMLYGMNVARSIIDEKTSRIFEVLLATIRPEAMMAGKIIGVGSVGLTQVGIWVSGAFLLAASSVAIHLGSDTVHFALTGPQVVFFFVYFLLGYLFYSSIAAAFGAMTNSEHELQQLNMFLVLPLLFCFVMLGTFVTTPDCMLARVLALMPPFTPLLMYFRVSLGHPAPWEIALSILLTSASIWGLIWITSRIYRVGVLMYGKRPTIPEVLRWLKYS